MNSISSVFKIHDTVLRVSEEAKTLLPDVKIIQSETRLLGELVLCILSSQERYEVALASVRKLKSMDLLKPPTQRTEFQNVRSKIRQILGGSIDFVVNGKSYCRRLRFFRKKTQFIIKTIERIYLNNLTINQILSEDTSFLGTRKAIIKYSLGLGPKQASMFLRNIGHHDGYAVLDKHVVDYMQIMGLASTDQKNFSRISIYEETENRLRAYADSYGISLFHLDLAIWTTMRNLKNYEQ
jgi:N-glycosylase/DNA lyase